MQYCFDRSFASSVVNSALASNVFEVPFVKRKASRRFIRSRATARVSCLFGLSSHSPTIYWCGGVRNSPGLKFKSYAVLGDDNIIADQEVAKVYESAVGWGQNFLSKIPCLSHRLSRVC